MMIDIDLCRVNIRRICFFLHTLKWNRGFLGIICNVYCTNFLQRWRKRWFILRHSGELPGQYFLCYYTDRNCRKLKGQIDLDQCEQVNTVYSLMPRIYRTVYKSTFGSNVARYNNAIIDLMRYCVFRLMPDYALKIENKNTNLCSI